MIKRMEGYHANQISAMQNRLIAMERAENNRFQPRPTMKDGKERGLPEIKGHLINWK
jgi:hypothetical protein